MTKRNYYSARYQAASRRLCCRALFIGAFSYAFVALYGALYGSPPAVVHHLGMTLAVLCNGLGGLFGCFFVIIKVVDEISKWRSRRRRAGYEY